ncbi:hypothetical protein [Paenibacillus sp. ATY16]|uniref:hypothetical protein n=1 Tax=Paenibacillus sp. ATY16 TaxID=1759312 RepID=UPI000E2F88FC|nr:hypothetical protein [Paenibacillus sp. ATY16]MCK9859277.1 hypothetical protein [Paenibacillus sp. ATY16]
MHEIDDEDEYFEGDSEKRVCDFCGQDVDWTESVSDIDKNGKEIELRSCLMCSFDGTGASREEIQEVMDQMKKNK